LRQALRRPSPAATDPPCEKEFLAAMSQPWLADLNPAQREAVTFGDGPLLIIAGAGTGKTKTLAGRVAWLIGQGVPADRILLLTFSRRAAAEMLSRAGRLIDQATTGKVWGGTFHAVGSRLLRIYGRALGLSDDFTVMDRGDSADLMNIIRSELGVAKNKKRFPKKDTLVDIYSHVVNAQKKLADVVERYFPWCADELENIARIFEMYTTRKRDRNVLDYDDLLVYWAALANESDAADAVADRFEHVLVDEYQDTNPLQSRILTGMRRRKRNICVVGDDAQSIYAFRAATIRNMLDFPEQFPGTQTVTLEQNYRSVQSILDASNKVMEQARERFTKNLWSQRRSSQRPVLVTCLDEVQQADGVCENILAHREKGVMLMDQAVLFRTGHHSARLEIELTRRNIPFHKFGGLRFVEAGHIKDLLAFLRILENPYDEVSWYRVLMLIPGVGPAAARRILSELGVRSAPAGDGDEAAAEEEGAEQPAAGPSRGRRGVRMQSVTSPVLRFIHAPPRVPPAAAETIESLRGTLRDCAPGSTESAESAEEVDERGGRSGPSLAAQLERVRQFYEPIFVEAYENAGARLRDIEQLQQIASTYRSRGRFITELTLDPPSSTSDLAGPPVLDDDWLTLSTIHSAKGMEWSVVHVIHAADGMIPSDMALEDEEGLEEERRLLYVAMTRAKDNLYVYFPLRCYIRRFSTNDRHGYTQLSRFLSREVRKLLDEQTPHSPADDDSPQRTAYRARDVDAGLRDLWKS
jgi:DNA helicase-2/ATP-dependent DNA helicase PcrA